MSKGKRGATLISKVCVTPCGDVFDVNVFYITEKCLISKVFYRIRNFYSSKIGTTCKRIGTNICNSVGDS